MWDEDEVYAFLVRTYGSRDQDFSADGTRQAPKPKLSVRGGNAHVRRDSDAGADAASADHPSIAISIDSRDAATPTDSLPVLQAFTSFTVIVLVVIVVIGALFLFKLGVCRASKRHKGLPVTRNGGRH